jgi:hypothetical protein
MLAEGKRMQRTAATARKGRWKRGNTTALGWCFSNHIRPKIRPIPYLKAVPDGHRCEDSMDTEEWVRDGVEVCENSGKAPWWRPQRWKGADALGASERAAAVEARGPGTIVEGTTTFDLGQEVRGLYKRFWRKRWNITEVRRSLFDGFQRVLLRASEDR